MSGREDAIAAAEEYFDAGGFRDDLARRVAIPTESQNPDRLGELYRYLEDELTPYLEALGFECAIYPNPEDGGGPFLVARRDEGDDLPTVMTYGHGDVVLGHEGRWRDDRDPWTLTPDGERWYGRGTADNKAQHTINLAALKCVLETRGRLGFNVVALFETGEERGSPGLHAFCEANRELFPADVLIASDGPRIDPEIPTLYGGTRGVFNFEMRVRLRDGGHHSGNWGGLLANPGVILANAIASVIGPTGQVLVEGWRPPPIPNAVRDAIGKLKIAAGEGAPEVDLDWGEPGLTPEEKVFGWNTFEVRAFTCGNPENPVNAIPPEAVAYGHCRFVVPTKRDELLPALRRHLDAHGFDMVELTPAEGMNATRLDPDDPWCRWAVASLQRSSGKEVRVIPNLGGSLPNDVFADILGLPTVWVPHSYAGCSQHAPNEHVLAPVMREALGMMAGLWWDMGEGGLP